MKKILLFFLLILLVNVPLFAQDGCSNFEPLGIPSCSCDDCGFIEPEWALVNGQSSVCDGEAFKVSAGQSSPLNLIEDYHWYFIETPGGIPNVLFDIVMTDTTPVEYTFSIDNSNIPCDQNSVTRKINLIITTPLCNEGESCREKTSSIEIKVKPKALFESNPEVCVGEPVSFGNTSCHADSYVWNFGDGPNTSTEENPDYTYNTPGTYTVTLTATNECGSNSYTQQIRVIGDPIAEVLTNLDPANGCLPLSAVFVNQSQNVNIPGQIIKDWEWDITPTTGWYFNPDTVYNYQSWDSIIVEFTEPGEYVIELWIENVCGTHLWETTIEVFEPPVATLSSPGSFCDIAEIDFDNFTYYDGSIISYDWTITPPSGGIIIYDEPEPSGTFSTPGVYNVELIVDGSPCDVITLNTTFEIQEPGVTSFQNPPTTVCTNDAPIAIEVSPTIGTWSTDNSGITFSNNELNPSNASAGSYTITFTPNGSCVTPNSFPITVLESPSVNIASVPVECDELIFDPNVTASGEYSNVTWEALNEAGTSIDNGTVNVISSLPNVIFNEAGENSYIITLDGVCGMTTDTITINIQSNEAISITPPPSPLCTTSSPIQLEATPPGGTWGPSSLISTDGEFDPTDSGAGSFTVTYSTASGACEAEQSVSVDVLASAEVTLEEDVFLCVDSDPRTLSFSPIGGTWTGDGIIDMNLGIFDAQSVGEGTYLLNYSYIDNSGCEVMKTTIVVVEDFPIINLNPSATFCVTDENIDLVDVLDLSVIPTGGNGVWTGEGIVDASSGMFNSSVTDTGNFIVTYTYLRNDCEVSDSALITVIEAPVAAAGADFNVCVDDGILILQGNPSGGIWSGNAAIDPNTGAINLAVVVGGTFNFTYTVQPGTTCEDADIAMVEIIDLSSNLNAGNDVIICEGAAPFQLVGYTPSGEGTWTGTGVDLAGFVTPSQFQPDSTYTLSYCLENQNLGCEACDDILLTVNPLPTANFQITSTTCIDEPVIFENLSNLGCTYSWEFGDGGTSNSETPTHVYTSTGNYTITLTTTSCDGCTDIFLADVFVTEPPTAFFETDLEEGCAVLEVDFDNQSFGTNISFAWDFGNGETSTLENPGPIFFQQGNYDTTFIIQLAVTNECGTIFYFDSVTVFPLPIVDMGTNVDDGCSPLEIEFANLTLGNPESYAWYIDGGLVSTDSLLENQIFTTSDTAITYYEVVLISENFCGSDTMSKIITVYPPDVDAFIQVDTTKGCQPLTVTFTNFSTPGATITWDFGDGNGSAEENPVYTFDSAGIFTVVQYAANCGYDTDTIVIEVLPQPEVSFTHNSYVCEGQPITFTNTSIEITGGIWDFGDGTSDTLTSPTHTYAMAGSYQISYTGFSEVNACPTTFTSTLEVLGNPDIDFIPSTTDGCVPLTIDFLNTSVGATYYEWIFEAGNSSNEVSPTYTFNTPGTFEVTLIGTDLFDCFSDTTVVNIIVHDIPNSNFVSDTTEYCAGVDYVIVTNLSSTDAIQYTWDFENGQTYPDFEPSVLLFDTGQTIISLTVENAFGCEHTSTRSIDVLGTPIALISNPLSDFVGCEPVEIMLANNSTFANQFEWNFGDGNTSTDFAPTHLYPNPDTYNLELIASNTNGCPSDTLMTLVQVNPKPESDFELDKTVICGIPDSVNTLFTGSTDALDFEWSFGDGSFSTFTNPTHQYDVPGEFDISLIVANIHGCLDTMSQMISVNQQPTAEIDPFEYIDCEPDTIQFLSTDPFADSWQWTFGDGTTSDEQNPLHIYPVQGEYNVELIVGNNNLCFDTLPVPGTVTILESPTAFFTWTDLEKGFIVFENSSSNAINYIWDFGDGNSSTEFSPTHEFTTNGEKLVHLTAIHENGCLDDYSELVMPRYFYGLFVPNAFSPRTGVGDVRLFRPAGIGLKEYHMQVFSTWGELLWETKELQAEQPVEGWDGVYKGKIMPQGAYVWKATVTYINDEVELKTGSVIILR